MTIELPVFHCIRLRDPLFRCAILNHVGFFTMLVSLIPILMLDNSCFARWAEMFRSNVLNWRSLVVYTDFLKENNDADEMV